MSWFTRLTKVGNPYHDASGEFTSAGGVGGGAGQRQTLPSVRHNGENAFAATMNMLQSSVPDATFRSKYAVFAKAVHDVIRDTPGADWSKLQPDTGTVTVTGGDRHVRQFGDATVLVFSSGDLSEAHERFTDAGASRDYDDYRPHVTISYGDVDMKKLNDAYDGPLVFGPEEFKPVKKDWADDIVEKADGPSLADKLNEAVMNGGTVPIDLGAQLTTSRLVSLGFLAEAMDQSETTYQVNEVLDGRTCPVCQFMHGKTFSVQPQFDRLVQSLSTSDPAALKDLMPWPDQSASGLADLQRMSPEEMQAQGFASPLYHPGG